MNLLAMKTLNNQDQIYAHIQTPVVITMVKVQLKISEGFGVASSLKCILMFGKMEESVATRLKKMEQ